MSHRFFSSKIYMLLIAAIFMVSACESLPQSDPQRVVEPNRIYLRLADAADRTAKAMDTLAAVEQAKSPAPVAQRIDNVPPELARTITINWVGPVAQVTRRMADRANYRFIELGDMPPVPIVINLDVVNTPIIDVLRDIGLQMNGRGSVVVDGQRRVVEVNYAPNAR